MTEKKIMRCLLTICQLALEHGILPEISVHQDIASSCFNEDHLHLIVV
jgi:hypothetical protein